MKKIRLLTMTKEELFLFSENYQNTINEKIKGVRFSEVYDFLTDLHNTNMNNFSRYLSTFWDAYKSRDRHLLQQYFSEIEILKFKNRQIISYFQRLRPDYVEVINSNESSTLIYDLYIGSMDRLLDFEIMMLDYFLKDNHIKVVDRINNP